VGEWHPAIGAVKGGSLKLPALGSAALRGLLYHAQARKNP
jgi:hypothetical protein